MWSCTVPSTEPLQSKLLALALIGLTLLQWQQAANFFRVDVHGVSLPVLSLEAAGEQPSAGLIGFAADSCDRRPRRVFCGSHRVQHGLILLIGNRIFYLTNVEGYPMTGGYIDGQVRHGMIRPIIAFREYIFRDVVPQFSNLESPWACSQLRKQQTNDRNGHSPSVHHGPEAH
jgi:hypothetical protein